MYGVSAAYRQALTIPHALISRIELWSGWQATATKSRDLLIKDATVTVDGTAAVRRRLTGEMKDQDLVPTGFGSPFAPGRVLKVFAGIQENVILPAGEMVPCGVFVLTKPSDKDTGKTFTHSFEAMDLSAEVDRHGLPKDYLIPNGTNYVTAWQALISSRVQGLTFSTIATTLTTPRIVYQAGDKPWQRAGELATAIGAVQYFDVNGVCTLAFAPNPLSIPAAITYAEGSMSILNEMDRSLDRDTTYNHVIVRGANVANVVAVWGEAVDDDPNSDTYIGNPWGTSAYGDVPAPAESDPYMVTAAQCVTRAKVALNGYKGLSERIGFTMHVNPAHEAYDVIALQRARLQVNTSYLLESFSFGLTPSARMTGKVKQRRLT